MGTVATWRESSPVVRLLMVNQFGVMLGFYLILPNLSAHLSGDLGLSAALVGLVLGVRTLSQQGMTLFGGTAADRLGCRWLILSGCALRSVAFVMFAMFDSLLGIMAAAVVTGISGAVFTPATRTYLTRAAGENKLAAYALFNMAGNTGALFGPLLGSVLLLWDFRVVAAVSAGVFAVLTAAQAFLLPPQPQAKSGRSVFGDWRYLMSDRPFLVFVAAVSVLFVAYNQLYLLLPMEITRVTGSAGSVSLIFVVMAVIGMAGSVPLATRVPRRLGRGRAVALGVALCGLAFVPTAFSGALQGGRPPGEGVSSASVPGMLLSALPVLAATVVLAVGHTIAISLSQEVAVSYAPPGLIGTYIGMFSMAAGLSAAGGNFLIGYLSDLGNRYGMRWLPWLFLVVLGAAAAWAVTRMRHIPEGHESVPARRAAAKRPPRVEESLP
ncbi:MFS transporter [Streptomyces sp. NPDC007100]|uniref:MFS transporter n=1 Tax=Streptomyces sp. NPDC007100 TaxID=3155602 RepID=UPI0033D061A8